MDSSKWALIGSLMVIAAVSGTLIARSTLASILADGDSRGSTNRTRVVVHRAFPTEAKPLTLLEAWAVVRAEATAWSDDSDLIMLASTDSPASRDTASGLDGRKRNWLAVAQAPMGSHMQLWMAVADGVVVNGVEQLGVSADGTLQRPEIDSPFAVNIAMQSVADFGPDKGKLTGVNFALLAGNGSASPYIRVLGSAAGFPAFVDIDGVTGQIIETQRQGYPHEGGVLYSPDGGLTWRSSTLSGLMVTSISAHPRQKEAAFATAATTAGVVIYRTNDSGETWVEQGTLPKAAGTWAYSIKAARLRQNVALLVGTPQGLWISWDEGVTWEQDSNIPPGPVWQIASSSNGEQGRVFISVVPNPEGAELYSSNDLITWAREGVGVFRLSESADGASVVAIEESSPGTALIFPGQGRDVLDLSFRASDDAATGSLLRVAGSFTAHSPWIGQDAASTRFSEDGASWRTTFEAPMASVAAAPDFDVSGIALAGGFRSGIFRTSNHGRTWTTVLDDPASVVPGSGVVTSVAFLSPTRALAIHGGNLEWQRP